MFRKESGIGAGIDSYYEYLLKAYIFLGDETFLERFNTHYQVHLLRIRSCKCSILLFQGLFLSRIKKDFRTSWLPVFECYCDYHIPTMDYATIGLKKD